MTFSVYCENCSLESGNSLKESFDVDLMNFLRMPNLVGHCRDLIDFNKIYNV